VARCLNKLAAPREKVATSRMAGAKVERETPAAVVHEASQVRYTNVLAEVEPLSPPGGSGFPPAFRKLVRASERPGPRQLSHLDKPATLRSVYSSSRKRWTRSIRCRRPSRKTSSRRRVSMCSEIAARMTSETG
jgi:hypothetical protein